MSPQLWKLIPNKTNREIISWLGGGAVVIIAGIWAAIVYFFPSQKAPEVMPSNIEASCGGVAIGGNVAGAIITGGTTTGSDCQTKPKRGAAP